MKFFLKDNVTKKIFYPSKIVKMYLCGPTVYNYVHIGNIRPILIFDVLCNVLKSLNYKVYFLHNITDVDDKIINESIKEKKTELEVSNFFYKNYIDVLKKLNVNLFFQIEKVTDNMQSIIDYISLIYKNGFAYENNGDIYFDTKKIKQYGIISNQNLSNLNSKNKSLSTSFNENDFALWKKTTNGIKWDSPWSYGRPGWHTECSCLINKYLGKSIDIHGGGIDLKFPHHENENAQNIAINGVNLSKIWIYIGHVMVNNEKMSKSLNNFLLVKDLLNSYNSNTIRWSLFQTNYYNPLNFDTNNIDKSKNEINFIIDSLNKVKSYLIINNKFKKIYKKDFKIKNIKHLCQNLNIPNHITFINEKTSQLNTLLKKSINSKLNLIYWDIFYMLSILNIKLENIHSKKNIRILLEWNKQKNNKNFEISDKLRNILIEKKLI